MTEAMAIQEKIISLEVLGIGRVRNVNAGRSNIEIEEVL